jgi:hypothetical protein
MGLDLNELRQEQTRLETQAGGTFLDNFVRMPEGDGIVTVRILPPKKGQKLFCVTRTHKLGKKNLHCPQTLVGGKWQGMCPICTYYRNLWKESDQKGGEEAEQLRAEARSIKPLERYYYNVIVRTQMNPTTGDLETNVGPKILSIGKQLHARIIRAILGDPSISEPELGDVTDKTTGRDFKIIKRLRKSGADSFPNYDESKFMGESILGTDKQIAQWMETLHDLQALRQLKPTDEILHELNIFRGLEKDPSTDFDVSNFKKPAETKVAPAVTAPASNFAEADESLADDDFLDSLRSM